MAWVYLLLAIGSEVAGTMSLRAASAGVRRAWYLAVVGGYVLAYVFLTCALRAGMGLGVAYGVWTAVGVAVTAVLGVLCFHERMTGLKALGMALVIGGVVLVDSA